MPRYRCPLSGWEFSHPFKRGAHWIELDSEMTDTLKPCPFCGGEMENRGYGVMHKNNTLCPLSAYAFDAVKWNTRADTVTPAPADLLSDPRVVALVKALRYMVNHAEHHERVDDIYWEATDKARDALAAITATEDGKP